jgi:hypothetical protein
MGDETTDLEADRADESRVMGAVEVVDRARDAG